MNHWQTTTAGIFSIIGAIAAIVVQVVKGQIDVGNLTAAGAALSAGVGLLKAADANKVITPLPGTGR